MGCAKRSGVQSRRQSFRPMPFNRPALISEFEILLPRSGGAEPACRRRALESVSQLGVSSGHGFSRAINTVESTRLQPLGDLFSSRDGDSLALSLRTPNHFELESAVHTESLREDPSTAEINRIPSTPSAIPGTSSDCGSAARPSCFAVICSAKSL